MSAVAHIVLPMERSYRDGALKSSHVVAVRDRRGMLVRFGVGSVARGSEARQEQGGPLVAGPWAYAFGLASVIDTRGGTGRERAENLAAGREHDVTDGDLLTIDGATYTVRVTERWGNVEIALVPAE